MRKFLFLIQKRFSFSFGRNSTKSFSSTSRTVDISVSTLRDNRDIKLEAREVKGLAWGFLLCSGWQQVLADGVVNRRATTLTNLSSVSYV